MIKTICVCGAGTMGAGIAQVVAQAQFQTILFDVNGAMLEKAKTQIETNLDFLINKGRLDATQKSIVLSNIQFTDSLQACKADLMIEAIIEKLEIKVKLFEELIKINSNQTIYASNTSSLSIDEIQNSISAKERFIGMHFFNPPTIMKLVEVVIGSGTAGIVENSILELCKIINKTAVVCKDAPGFIVNRVARHYYLESMKIAMQKGSSIEEIDSILEASGFKLGPFKLMDLIGMDINLSVSQQLYAASGNEPRFKPSEMQIGLVEAGKLGRKSGEGFYKYQK